MVLRLKKLSEQRRLTNIQGVIVTEKLAREYRDHWCQGCAGEKKNPKLYFGQTFCGDCVDKWQHGKR